MPLHPQARTMIDAFAIPVLDCATLTAAQFRAAFEPPAPTTAGPEIARISDRVIAGASGPIGVRLYYPDETGPRPMMLFLHGGGFVIGNPKTTDGICKTLAAGARTLVISPDYRLAPEAPFPAGLDDAWATLRWACDHAQEIGGDASRIAVGGDSSGGNFAAVIAQMSRGAGMRLRHQLLLYPALDRGCATPSFAEF